MTLMLYTLGHSTLSIEEFLQLATPLDGVIDVRAFPGSRRFPHFSRQEMSRWLGEASLSYEWLPALGGRRQRVDPRPGLEPIGAEDSGWREQSFANYALLMTRDEWLEPVEQLLRRAGAAGSPALGLLCAEVLWWRCHRSLIADYLVWRGLQVLHLRPGAVPESHAAAAEARLARYHPAIIGAWREWLAGTVEPD